jgi:hypothetical protein
LSRIQQRPKSHLLRKPSKTTLAVTGSTIVAAVVATGVVLWPASVPGPSAATMLNAASARSAQQADAQLRLGGTGALAPQAEMATADAAQRREQSLVLAAEVVAARRAAARQTAERRAAAAAAREAARLAAQQQAQEVQQAAQQRTQQTQPAPAVAAPSGSPQHIALGMLASYGWSSSQFSCLDSLWDEESGWNLTATNPSSGAYGIPQALPGSKMASAGPDWQTDAATQIRWGLGYIQETYGSPCSAWAHEQADGWY